MSTKVMGQVWDLDLPHAEAWVLMALADHADHNGANAFPGQALLAYKTGYSARQVRRILDALEKKRIIIAEGGGRGRGATRRYRLLLQNAPKKEDKMSGYSKQKRGQDVRSKEDRASGYLPQKSGQNDRSKGDILSGFPEAKTGHFEHEKADISSTKKRTFLTQKADIFDTPHDKERARINHHEPSIEPSEEEGASSPFDNFTDKETEMALAVATVMGLPDTPEGDHARPIFAAAREFVAAGLSANDVAEFEQDFHRRKMAQGKRVTLTLKILREDLPGWGRSRRRQGEGGKSSVVDMPAWRKQLLGLN